MSSLSLYRRSSYSTFYLVVCSVFPYTDKEKTKIITFLLGFFLVFQSFALFSYAIPSGEYIDLVLLYCFCSNIPFCSRGTIFLPVRLMKA